MNAVKSMGLNALLSIMPALIQKVDGGREAHGTGSRIIVQMTPLSCRPVCSRLDQGEVAALGVEFNRKAIISAPAAEHL